MFQIKVASDMHMDQIIHCYIAAFATEPWNEWRLCPVCAKAFGLTAPRKCPECLCELSPFYSVDYVKDYFKKLFLLQGRINVALGTDGRVVGWNGWGSGTLRHLNAVKYKLSTDEYSIVECAIKKSNRVFTSWGLGVLPSYRKRGVGLALLERLIEDSGRPLLARSTLAVDSPIRNCLRKLRFDKILVSTTTKRSIHCRCEA